MADTLLERSTVASGGPWLHAWPVCILRLIGMMSLGHNGPCVANLPSCPSNHSNFWVTLMNFVTNAGFDTSTAPRLAFDASAILRMSPGQIQSHNCLEADH